jgi:hypothetical protein
MLLTEENYHSPEASQEYMGSSQYKDFQVCEAMALAKIKGEYNPPQTIECLTGSYLHAWNSNTIETFKANAPMFKKNGEPLAQFLFADQMIAALESDAFCMMMLEGQKEVIMTAEMFGAPWKIKIDSYKPEDSIVDLKTTRSIWEQQWDSFYNCKVSFIEMYRYFTQFAIYTEVERLATGGDKRLSSYIVAVSKETPPDKAIIDLSDEMRIQSELLAIKNNMPRILAVKSGEVNPKRCGHCAYCRSINRVTDIISYRDLEQREAV